MYFSETTRALQREGIFAAESMAMGINALGNADYVRIANYPLAFFSLSAGLERAAKLALCLQHYVINNKFPSRSSIRAYGHALNDLLNTLDSIGEQLPQVEHARLPTFQIHVNIVSLLSDFANNLTRYYNLDFLTGPTRNVNSYDPIERWYDQVILEVLRLHLTARRRARIESYASTLDRVYGDSTVTMLIHENGSPLDTVFESSRSAELTTFAVPYTRMYVLQICRFVSTVLAEIFDHIPDCQMDEIPDM